MSIASERGLRVVAWEGVAIVVLAAILFAISFVADPGAIIVGAFGVHLLTTWASLLTGSPRVRLANLLMSIAVTMFLIAVLATNRLGLDGGTYAIVTIAFVIVVLNGILPFWRERSRSGRCPTCGYDLRAHPRGSTCPECGNP